MTSEEIKSKHTMALSVDAWLQEVCLQLALMNERQAPPVVLETPPERVKRPYNRKVE